MNRELITEIARGVVKDIGYDQDGFSWHGADVEVLLHGQSPDIAMGVNAKKKKGGEEEGAGDQGMMFGFACTESEVYEKGSFMPAPIFFAHKILQARCPSSAAPASCSICSPTRRARSRCSTSTARRSAAPRSWSRRSTMRRTATARNTRPAWCAT